MALVSSIEHVSRDQAKVHKPTRCTYFEFLDHDDKRYLQFDTYGSEDRQFPDKTSQSMQFDESAARQVLTIIREVFPNLT